MSTLKTNNLQAVSGGAVVPIADVVNGVCRAWVNFNGTGTPAIRASYNVASITDNGVGDYTINFTTALTDANCAAVGTSGDGSAANNSVVVGPRAAPTTTSFRMYVTDITTSLVDRAYISLAFFR